MVQPRYVSSQRLIPEADSTTLALLFYDYTLTFPMEVKYVWGSKARVSTVLYIFCRYALVANVLYLLAIANQLKQGVRFLK